MSTHPTKPEPSAQDEMRAEEAAFAALELPVSIVQYTRKAFKGGAQWQATRQAAPDSRANGNSTEVAYLRGLISDALNDGAHGGLSVETIGLMQDAVNCEIATPSDLHAAIRALRPSRTSTRCEDFKLGYEFAKIDAAELVAGAAPVPKDTTILVAALEKLSKLGNGGAVGNSIGNTIAYEALDAWAKLPSSKAQTAVAVPQWVVDGVNSAWDRADTPEAMSVHYKVEVSLDLFREIHKAILAANQPEQSHD